MTTVTRKPVHTGYGLPERVMTTEEVRDLLQEHEEIQAALSAEALRVSVGNRMLGEVPSTIVRNVLRERLLSIENKLKEVRLHFNFTDGTPRLVDVEA